MNHLFKYSIEGSNTINLIYINNKGELTYRSVIVRKINVDSILAYDLKKQQLRTFTFDGVLSVAKPTRQRGVSNA
ncbi:hypothetical protein [Cytobacillus purgationiresistens]|uniref:DNA-binding transcriptional regulator YafY n=1 Tax=Cytobacillus purgationiresistens TaxID=863449 RepID=A0ABU0AC76_9BACI|nr:hypothetical protein [Cytobacillus purgationiresistens]MDQ0268856.1 putative DNA-binding transcriptional regulator YafY [Cytobacillus purgationiresistens]